MFVFSQRGRIRLITAPRRLARKCFTDNPTSQPNLDFYLKDFKSSYSSKTQYQEDLYIDSLHYD